MQFYNQVHYVHYVYRVIVILQIFPFKRSQKDYFFFISTVQTAGKMTSPYMKLRLTE